MKLTGLFMAAILLLANLNAGNDLVVANEIDSELATLFKYANSHDAKSLEKLRDKTMAKEKQEFRSAYYLALYIAAPKKYKEQYVENFPASYEGLMLGYYDKIEVKKLTPYFLYSIDSLGKIAAEGHKAAIEKIILSMNISDGIVSEKLCDELLVLYDKQLEKTINAFSSIESRQRQKAYSCFEFMSEEEFKTLINRLNRIAEKATKSEIAIIHEMQNYQ